MSFFLLQAINYSVIRICSSGAVSTDFNSIMTCRRVLLN